MSYLDDLVAGARRRADELKVTVGADTLEQRVAGADPPRGFTAALDRKGVAVIGEIKRASPSAGALNSQLNARNLAASYARGGAAAISVLTEPQFFLGSLEDLAAAREAGLPVLRKDFIVDPLQVLESRAWGADAVLLIVRALGGDLGPLYDATRALGMDALVEVHDESDLDAALEIDAVLIGINHRDLATFAVKPDRTAVLAPMVPPGRVVVTLSGVHSRADVSAAAAAGARAVLVGEALVTARDPAAAVESLRVPT
jgi:indole-3-glycerol phosphate synthase